MPSKRMEHRAGAEAVHRAAPVRACPQIDGVVISVCEPEPKQDAARGLQPERVDELLSHEAHRGRAEDDDALLVQPNDALIRPKIEQFGEVQIAGGSACRRGVIGTSPYLPLYGVRRSVRIPDVSGSMPTSRSATRSSQRNQRHGRLERLGSQAAQQCETHGADQGHEPLRTTLRTRWM